MELRPCCPCCTGSKGQPTPRVKHQLPTTVGTTSTSSPKCSSSLPVGQASCLSFSRNDSVGLWDRARLGRCGWRLANHIGKDDSHVVPFPGRDDFHVFPVLPVTTICSRT